MATQEQLEEALRASMQKARSGDARAAELARRFATELQAMRQPAQQPAQQPTFAQALEQFDPTEGMSTFDRVAAGAGKSVADTWLGLRQLVGNASQEEVDNAREIGGPLMNTAGGMTGNIAGQVAQIAALPGIGAGGRVAAAAGRGLPFVNAAVQGAAFAGSQGVGAGESRIANTAAGAALGAAGQGIASGLSKAASTAKASLGPEVLRAIENARRLKIPLNVANVTDSAPVRAAQSVTKYLPFSGASRAAAKQQQAFNRAVGKTFGADATTLTDDVMRQARKRLGGEFDDIYSRNSVEISPDVARRMASIEREAFQDMTADQAGIIRNQVEKVLSEATDGLMTGQKYQAVRTSLQNAEKAGGNIGRMVKAVRSALDDAAALSVGPDDAARLKAVRSGWANLRTTEDALKQVAGSAGNVRPTSLFPLIRKGSTPEMRVLAKVGQNVLKETIGDSGTGPRNLWAGILTGGGLGGGYAGGLAGAASAASGLAQLAGVGAVAGRVLNTNTASKLLQKGRPLSGLAKAAKVLPRALPVAAPAAVVDFNIGNVSGYDPSDPRYRGN